MEEEQKIAAVRAELTSDRAKIAAWANGLGTSDPSEYHRLQQRVAENRQLLKDLGVSDA